MKLGVVREDYCVVQVIDGCATMADGATSTTLTLKSIPPLQQRSTRTPSGYSQFGHTMHPFSRHETGHAIVRLGAPADSWAPLSCHMHRIQLERNLHQPSGIVELGTASALESLGRHQEAREAYKASAAIGRKMAG